MTLFFPQSEDRENSATKHIYTLGLVAFIKSPAGITSYRWQHVRGFRRSHETCKSKRWGTRVESKGFDFAPAPGPPSLVGSRPRAIASGGIDGLLLPAECRRDPIYDDCEFRRVTFQNVVSWSSSNLP